MSQRATTPGRLLADAGRGPMNRLCGAGPFMGGPAVALSTPGSQGTGEGVVAVQTTIYSSSHDTLPTKENGQTHYRIRDNFPRCTAKLSIQAAKPAAADAAVGYWSRRRGQAKSASG